MALFGAVLWTVISPLFCALLHLHLPQLPVVTMPFRDFFRSLGALPHREPHPVFPNYPRPQEHLGNDFAPKPLWFAGIVASKIPDAPQTFQTVGNLRTRRCDAQIHPRPLRGSASFKRGQQTSHFLASPPLLKPPSSWTHLGGSSPSQARTSPIC